VSGENEVSFPVAFFMGQVGAGVPYCRQIFLYSRRKVASDISPGSGHDLLSTRHRQETVNDAIREEGARL